MKGKTIEKVKPDEDVLSARTGAEGSKAGMYVWQTSRPKPQNGTKRKQGGEEQTECDKEIKEARQKAARDRRAEALAKVQRTINVGIDFGTTHCGIGYVSSSAPNGSAEVIMNWSGKGTGILEKVPTRIAYGVENDREVDCYGYAVGRKSKCCEWFKLALDTSTAPGEFDDPLLFQSQGQGFMHCPPGKTCLDVCQDFLSWLYKHTMESLRGFVGSALDETPIQFHITVPAMWKFAAREATKQAAQNAGFGKRRGDTLVLIDEPEAAAIYALRSNADCFKNSVIKAGTTIIMADFGGGTLDFVSYKIVRLDPLNLVEACSGAGAKQGGTAIDRQLHALLTERFKEAFCTLDGKVGAGSAFMASFETIKRGFNSDQLEQTFELPLKMKDLNEADMKMKSWYDFDEEQVKLTGYELASMFDTVIKAGLDLLRSQYDGIRAANMPVPTAIILCGGLGSSSYVVEKVRAFCKAELVETVEVLWPQHPWSSVQRGAALRGTDKPPVLFRRSRDFIGILVHEKFVEGKHSEADAYIDDSLREKRARHQFKCVIERGEQIAPKMNKKFECFHTIRMDDHRKMIKVRQGLYSCTSSQKPQAKNNNMTKIGEIEIDITKIVLELRKEVKGKPTTVRTNLGFPITIELDMGADKGVLNVLAKVGNRKVGRTEIEYEASAAWQGQLISGDSSQPESLSPA